MPKRIGFILFEVLNSMGETQSGAVLLEYSSYLKFYLLILRYNSLNVKSSITWLSRIYIYTHTVWCPSHKGMKIEKKLNTKINIHRISSLNKIGTQIKHVERSRYRKKIQENIIKLVVLKMKKSNEYWRADESRQNYNFHTIVQLQVRTSSPEKTCFWLARLLRRSSALV